MTGQRTNIAITAEGWAAATEKLRAERAAHPQLAAIDKAMEYTTQAQEQQIRTFVGCRPFRGTWRAGR